MKNLLIIVICFVALAVGAMFPLRVTSAQFIDRIVRPCSAGAAPRAQVVANPNNTGNVAITTCTGGSVTINGATVTTAPPGANTQIIFNDGGAFGADAGFTYNKTTDTISIGGNIFSITLGGAIGSTGVPFNNVIIGSAAGQATVLSSAATAARNVTFPDLAGTVALTANNLGAFAATTSAQLRTVLSDENGTGAALFDSSTSATFITPSLGAATATTINGAAINNLAWTAYTPTVTSGIGTFTTVSATGSHKMIGKTVAFQIVITITTNGTAAGTVLVTLPSTAASSITIAGREGALTGSALSGAVAGGSNSMQVTMYNNLYPGGTGAIIIIGGVYEQQ